MPNLQDPFQSYMLRYWAEHTDEHEAAVWRFSLVDIENQQRVGFADLRELVDWLSEQTEMMVDEPSALSE